MKKPKQHIALAAGLMLALSAPALAHDTVLKPGATTVAEGKTFPVQMLLTEVYLRGDHILPAERMNVDVINGEQKTRVTLSPNEKAKALEGQATAPTAKTFLITAQSSGFRSMTPEGPKPVPKTAPGASDSVMSERFSKALINLSRGDDGYSRVAGHRLEIVPVGNPAAHKVGNEIVVKILFDGKPVSEKLYATYDGFSERDDTFAYFTESAKDGVAYIKITHPGLWVVRTAHSVAETAATHDRYSATAFLLLEMKK